MLPLHLCPDGDVWHCLYTFGQTRKLFGSGGLAPAHILIKSRATGTEGRGAGLKQYISIQIQCFYREFGPLPVDIIEFIAREHEERTIKIEIQEIQRILDTWIEKGRRP